MFIVFLKLIDATMTGYFDIHYFYMLRCFLSTMCASGV